MSKQMNDPSSRVAAALLHRVEHQRPQLPGRPGGAAGAAHARAARGAAAVPGRPHAPGGTHPLHRWAQPGERKEKGLVLKETDRNSAARGGGSNRFDSLIVLGLTLSLCERALGMGGMWHSAGWWVTCPLAPAFITWQRHNRKCDSSNNQRQGFCYEGASKFTLPCWLLHQCFFSNSPQDCLSKLQSNDPCASFSLSLLRLPQRDTCRGSAACCRPPCSWTTCGRRCEWLESRAGEMDGRVEVMRMKNKTII